MYGPTDLKKGVIIQLGGKPFAVIEYAQKVMGRGGSIVNVKLKNLIDGSVIPKTFKGSEKIEPAEVHTKVVQYLYGDGGRYNFMDSETYEQFELGADVAEQAAQFLKEGSEVNLQLFDGHIINLELPKNLFLKVTYAEDVVAGNTSGSLQKDATLETGLVLKVPAFIKTGDTVKVDTRSGAYLERKK